MATSVVFVSTFTRRGTLMAPNGRTDCVLYSKKNNIIIGWWTDNVCGDDDNDLTRTPTTVGVIIASVGRRFPRKSPSFCRDVIADNRVSLINVADPSKLRAPPTTVSVNSCRRPARNVPVVLFADQQRISFGTRQ